MTRVSAGPLRIIVPSTRPDLLAGRNRITADEITVPARGVRIRNGAYDLKFRGEAPRPVTVTRGGRGVGPGLCYGGAAMKSPCDDCPDHSGCRMVICPTLNKYLEKEFTHGPEKLFCEIEVETESGKVFNPALDTIKKKDVLSVCDIEHTLSSRPMPKMKRIERIVWDLYHAGNSYTETARAASGPGRKVNTTRVRNILYRIRQKIKALESTD